MIIPEDTTHIIIPVDLFIQLVKEANHGYYGFNEDTDLWNRIEFLRIESK